MRISDLRLQSPDYRSCQLTCDRHMFSWKSYSGNDVHAVQAVGLSMHQSIAVYFLASSAKFKLLEFTASHAVAYDERIR